MSTQQIQRITQDEYDNPHTLPVPAWYFVPERNYINAPCVWFRRGSPFDRLAVVVATHWHPDQAEPPTERPESEPSYFGAYAGVGVGFNMVCGLGCGGCQSEGNPTRNLQTLFLSGGPAMSTHPITPGTVIPFPCWLKYVDRVDGADDRWDWVEAPMSFESVLGWGYRYYSTNPPDQRPEDVVEDWPKIPAAPHFKHTADGMEVAGSLNAKAADQRPEDVAPQAIPCHSPAPDKLKVDDLAAAIDAAFGSISAVSTYLSQNGSACGYTLGEARAASENAITSIASARAIIARHLAPLVEENDALRAALKDRDGQITHLKEDSIKQDLGAAALRAENEKGSKEYRELRGLYRETCETIDRLRAEVERLTKERDDALHHLGDHTAQLVAEVDETARLTAELEEWQTTFEGWGETPKAAHDKIIEAAERLTKERDTFQQWKQDASDQLVQCGKDLSRYQHDSAALRARVAELLECVERTSPYWIATPIEEFCRAAIDAAKEWKK